MRFIVVNKIIKFLCIVVSLLCCGCSTAVNNKNNIIKDSEDLPQIISTSNDKTINKPCDIYTHLYLYTKNLSNELLSFYPNITDYDNYLETIA
jgi:serine protease inhibitor